MKDFLLGLLSLIINITITFATIVFLVGKYWYGHSEYFFVLIGTILVLFGGLAWIMTGIFGLPILIPQRLYAHGGTGYGSGARLYHKKDIFKFSKKFVIIGIMLIVLNGILIAGFKLFK